MACQISYKDREVLANNIQFSSLVDFAVEVGNLTARDEREQLFVDRMARMQENEFWPGRGIKIEEDFPDIEEQKFWSRVFLDVARAIFDRRIGNHEHSFWQAQCISQAYGTGQIFLYAVRQTDRNWSPDSTDYREFGCVVNNRRP
jgi:hypothetical protein